MIMMAMATPPARRGAPIPAEAALLDIDQVSRTISFGKSWIWDRVKDGTFPAPVKLGASTRWRRADVDAWLADLTG